MRWRQVFIVSGYRQQAYDSACASKVTDVVLRQQCKGQRKGDTGNQTKGYRPNKYTRRPGGRYLTSNRAWKDEGRVIGRVNWACHENAISHGRFSRRSHIRVRQA